MSNKFGNWIGTYVCFFFLSRDLAVDMRMKLGDWFRVVQLVKWGGGGGENKALYIIMQSINILVLSFLMDILAGQHLLLFHLL